MCEKSLVINWKHKYFQEVKAHKETREELYFERDCFESACKRISEVGKWGLSDMVYKLLREDMKRKYSRTNNK